jgi:alkylated DNA repair dioxygenase AlkB
VHQRTLRDRRVSTILHDCTTRSASSPPPYASVGKLISEAKTTKDLLLAAGNLWIPHNDIIEIDPDSLPPHVLHQQVHHEKRLRWSSQILQKLGEQAVTMTVHGNFDSDIWQDSNFHRAILAASIPFQNDFHTDREHRELRYLNEALQGIYNLVSVTTIKKATLSACIIPAIQLMMERVEALAPQAALAHAVELRWSCRGIRSKLGKILSQYDNDDSTMSMLLPPQPTLEARVERLPFDVLFSCIDWNRNDLFPENKKHQTPVQRLRDQIEFTQDTIVTRTGAAVQERRSTAWIAQDGIGALAYSGKLMHPGPITPVVQNIMTRVEEAVFDNGSGGSVYLRPFFDCVLCNFYPDGDSACKFHTDPEHGSHWERLTCVVAAGEPRRFAFRPIPGLATWSEWESNNASANLGATKSVDDNVPAVLTLFPGDVVKMDGSCNDDFHHAVYPEHGISSTADDHDRQGRVSLVLKRAIDRNGRRGHGVAGQGRKARRRARYDESPVLMSRNDRGGSQKQRQPSKGHRQTHGRK